MAKSELWKIKYSEEQLLLLADISNGLHHLKDPRATALAEEFFDVMENHKSTIPAYRKIKGSAIISAFEAASSHCQSLKSDLDFVSTSTQLTLLQGDLAKLNANTMDIHTAGTRFYSGVLKQMKLPESEEPEKTFVKFITEKQSKMATELESIAGLKTNLNNLYGDKSIVATQAEELHMQKIFALKR